jgi:hypothetical protein
LSKDKNHKKGDHHRKLVAFLEAQDRSVSDEERAEVEQPLTELYEKKKEIEEWETIPTPTALDLKAKKDALSELRPQVAALHLVIQRLKGYPTDGQGMGHEGRSVDKNESPKVQVRKGGRPAEITDLALCEVQRLVAGAQRSGGGVASISAICAKFVADNGGQARTGYSAKKLRDAVYRKNRAEAAVLKKKK